MTETVDIATRLEDWVVASTDPAINSYPEDPGDFTNALPLVAANIQRKRHVASGGEFPKLQYQQTMVRIWTVRLMIMVTPEPSWTASQELYKYVDQLDDALLRDPTLGGRVEAAAPETDTEFPGEVEHASGLVALVAFYQISVGEMTQEV